MLLISISEVSSNANTISQYIYFSIFAYVPKPEKLCYFFWTRVFEIYICSEEVLIAQMLNRKLYL